MPLTEPLYPKTPAVTRARKDDDSSSRGPNSIRSPIRGSYRSIRKKKIPSSTPAILADKPAWEAQYDFCKYGIDKPILDDWSRSQLQSRGRKSCIPILTPVKEGRVTIDQPSPPWDDGALGKSAIQRQVRGFFFPAKNRKGCLKVSRGDRADDEEKHHPWVIHPSSFARYAWDFLVIFLVVVILIEAPLKIAFFPKLLDPPELLILNVVLDIFFALDIFLNFWTGFFDGNTAVKTLRMKPQDIRRAYLRGWFAVDFISTIPFDYTIIPLLHSLTDIQIPPDGLAVKVVKILAMLRALRFCRLYRYLPRLQNIFYAQEYMYARVLNLALLMVIGSHWNGCIHFLVDSYLGFPPKCWISLNDLQTAPWWEQWSWALFNAISQTFGIGFGRSTPDDLTDMWFTLWGMISGTSGYALILAHIATMWQHVDGSRKLHTQKMQEIEDYMNFRRFSARLRSRVRDYFEERYQGRVFNEDKILKTLSDPLREVVMRHNCGDTVRSVPFFAKVDSKFVDQLVTKLKFSFFQPDDLVIKFGTVGSNMFFIQSGKVTVANENGKVLTTLTGGMYFGELSIIIPCKRNATVRAKTHCSLLELRSEDFHQILDQFPQIEQAIRSLATDVLSDPSRSSQMSNDEQDTVTSLGSFIQF